MKSPGMKRVLLLVAILCEVLWTLAMGLGYALITFSDEITIWLNRVLGVPADMAQWLATAGMWLEQWGGWLLFVIWATGLVALLLLSWFASRIARHFFGPEGAPS